MGLRVGPGGRPLYVNIPEGRFWKPGRSHRIRTLELRPLGAIKDGAVSYVAKAFTECGETIDFAELTHEQGTRPCKRCER